MKKNGCDLGLIGLGVMGRNFLLNVADHGFSVAGYDLEADKVRQLEKERAAEHDIRPTADLAEFIASLRRPAAVMLLVPAGDPVDSVIGELAPRLERDDLIVDGGNSHFADTDRRGRALEEKGLLFLGTGISGGESGARHGPSIMPGGPPKGYQRVKKIFEKAAAQVDGDPCVTHLGKGSAGHYVKMVHNGIEYGFMELIAEVYDFLRRGLELSAPALHETFEEWNREALESYLVQITSRIFSRIDDKTDRPLVEQIRDAARQKGTGMWTSQDAMALQVPTPTIDAAVMMRNLSAQSALRRKTAALLSGPQKKLSGPRERWIERLKEALHAGLIVTFAQGMALLQAASTRYGYDLDLAAVARIWRGGCIIRASVLEEIRSAYERAPQLENLLLDPNLGHAMTRLQGSLREAVAAAPQIGVPFPGFSASIGYYDGYRSDRLPANLIQAQRDYFGSHRYERIDAQGTFHTRWEEA
ncbi:MAG: NADP-dependent phosphogluconate dehydrogenase [Desulfosarcinaceae bacterium]|jgi:6-phosphogluconate dehydrogenase